MADQPLSYDELLAQNASIFGKEPTTPGSPAAPTTTAPTSPAGGGGLLSSAWNLAKDTGIHAVKGAIGLGESAVGIADLMTGNLAGRGLSALGYDPKAARQILSSGYSPEQQEAERAVGEAKGFFPTAKAYLQNPRALWGQIAESAPGSAGVVGGAKMVLGKVASKMLADAGLKLGTAEAAAFLSSPAVRNRLISAGALASGASEGLQTAGQIQEQGRQQGRDWSQTMLPALAAGAGTGAVSVLSSKIPGFRDVESKLAMGGMPGEIARHGLLARGQTIARDLFKEGVLEEMPQSAQEQIFTNLAMGKPWHEGVAEAAAGGALVGSVQGGAMSGISEFLNRNQPAVNPNARQAIADALRQMFPATPPPQAPEQPAPFPARPGAMQPGSIFMPQGHIPNDPMANQDLVAHGASRLEPGYLPEPDIQRPPGWDAVNEYPPHDPNMGLKQDVIDYYFKPNQAGTGPSQPRDDFRDMLFGQRDNSVFPTLEERNQAEINRLFPQPEGSRPVIDLANRGTYTPDRARAAVNQQAIDREFTEAPPTMAERNQAVIDEEFGATKRPVPPPAETIYAPLDLTTDERGHVTWNLPAEGGGRSNPVDVFEALKPTLSENAPEMTMTIDGLAVTPRDWSDENVLVGQLGAVPDKAGNLVIPNDRFTTAETFDAIQNVFGRTVEEEANMIYEADRQKSKDVTRATLENTLAAFKGDKRLKATTDEFRAMVHSEYPDLAKQYVVPKPSKGFQQTPMAAQPKPMEQMSMFPEPKEPGKMMAKAPKPPKEGPPPTEAYHWSDEPRKVIKGYGAKGVIGKQYSGQKRDMQDRDSKFVAPPEPAAGLSAAKIAKIGRYEPYSDFDLGRTPEKQVPGEAWHGPTKYVHSVDISGYYDGNKDPLKLWEKTNQILEVNPQLHRRNVFAGLVKDAKLPGYILNIDPSDPSKGRWASGFGNVPVKRVVSGEQFRKETADEEARSQSKPGPRSRFAYGNDAAGVQAGAPAGPGPGAANAAAYAQEDFQTKAQEVGFTYEGPFQGLPGRAPFQQFTNQETGGTFLKTPDETFEEFIARVAPKKPPKKTVQIDEGMSLEDAIARANKVFEDLEKPQPNVPLAWSQEVASKIQTKLAEGIYVRVVATPFELPEKAQKGMKESLKKGTVPYGWFDPDTNTAYVINSALETQDQIYDVIAHELVGHLGLWNFLGKDYVGVLLSVYEGLSDKQKAEIKHYGFDENRPLGRLGIVEEYVAYLAETGENPGLLKRIISHIRLALRAMGLNVSWSDNDIRVQLLARSGEYLLPGRGKLNYWGLKEIGNGLMVARSLDVTKAYVDQILGGPQEDPGRFLVRTPDIQNATPASPPIEIDYLVDGKLLPQLKDLPQDPNVQRLWSAVSAVVRSHLDPSRAYLGLNKGMVEGLLGSKPKLSGDANAAWTDLQNFYAKNLMSKKTVKVETQPTHQDERYVRFMAKVDPKSPLADDDPVKRHLVPYMNEARRQMDLAGNRGIQTWIWNNRPTVAGDLKRLRQEIAEIIEEYRQQTKQEGPPSIEQVRNWQAQVQKSQEITKRFKDKVTEFKRTMIDAIREQAGKTEVRPQGLPEYTVNGERLPVITSDSHAVQGILARLNRFLADYAGVTGRRELPLGNRILAQKAIESAIRKARGGQLGTYKPTITGTSMTEINQLQDFYEKHFGRVHWEAPRKSKFKSPDVRMVAPGSFMVKKAKDFPLNPIANGHEITEPIRSYSQSDKGKGNVWVRQSMTEDNSNRQLMVQFSTHLINQNATPGDDSDYYDALYSGSRPGYDRLHDFWEVPQWMGFASNFLPNADVYVIRDMAEAKKFFNEAGYERLMFSAIDVNTNLIKQVAEGYKGQIDVGGYTKPDAFNKVSNIKWHDSMKDFANSIGAEYAEGTDYRHFTEGKVIPRLTMSQGCLHKCAFCTVPKKLVKTPSDVIKQQAKSFAALDSKLVYLNDKTFGQADNYRELADVYQIMKKDNPSFEGFIIQTTATQIGKMDSAWLKKSGIKFVELGVESYNDLILQEMNKPHREAHIDKAMDKLRRADIQVIPNIIIGMPGETGATYARTLDFLARNKDIISHANIYNLAVYDNTALSKEISAADANDLDENVRAKSFHTDKKIHDDFAVSVFQYGKNQLTSKGLKPPTSGPAGETAPVVTTEAIKTPGIEDVSGPGKFMVKKVSKPQEPKKTITAYKLLRTMKKKAGELFPLFIKKSDPVPQGQWVQGEYVPTKGFAKRPGWHAGSLPYAPHLMKKDGTMQPNRVWTEVSMPDDVDYTEAAQLAGKKGLSEVPVNGHYRFKPAKNQGKEWLIAGAVKINRVLTQAEVDEINAANGVGPKPGGGKLMAKEPTQLITKPVRDFAEKMRMDVRAGVQEMLKKINEYSDWPYEVGARVRSNKTGKVWKITSKSWNTKKDVPLYRMASVDGTEAADFYAQKMPEGFTELTGPQGKLMVKPTKEPTKAVSDDPDVETRWKAAYEKQGNLWERVRDWTKDTFAETKGQITRHFKDLNPKTDGEIIEIMRQQETVPSISVERAGEFLKRLQDALGRDPENTRLFERIVILSDLAREIQYGKLQTATELPFGYRDLDAVNRDLEKFKALAGDPVKAALKERDDYYKRLVDLAKRHKVLNENATDKDYFHHQVSLYQALQGNYVGGPKELRKTTKAFQRKRTGATDDYNTNYFLAEHDVVSGLINQIETARTIEALQNAKANVLNEMVEKAKAEDLTPKEAIKKYYQGYRLFNTERNPLFRRRIALADQDARATQEAAGVLASEFDEPDSLDELIARAKVSDVLLVPNNVADALDNFRPEGQGPDNVLAQASAETMKLWKQWVLFNPLRVIRYSFNNATGDADVVFAYRPDILRKYAVQAAKDLFQWNYRKVETGSDLWKELGKWRRKGLLNSGITINEIPNLSDSKLLNSLMNPDQAFVGRYFATVKKFNNYRENILRLATVRYMMDQMKAGKEAQLAFASSRPAEVQAIPKAVDRAAKMARELVGDYGNVSYLGQRISRHIIPFWSWMEINAPRYMRMMRNEIRYGSDGKARMLGMAAWSGAKLTAKMTAFAALVSLWNATMFPDEDDEFRRAGRNQLQLILGRNPDGSILSVRMQGAFSDMMSWVGLENTPQSIRNIVSGQKPFGDAMKESLLATPKKLVGSALPLSKGVFEAGVGKTTFPEPFEARPIRDRWQHLFRSFGLEAPYNWAAGKPSTPGPLDDLKKVFFYDTDPGEASYYWSVGKINDYLKKQGQPKAGGAPTPKSNALFYYKLAVRKGDKEAQQRYLKEYLDLSKGKLGGLDQSLKQNDPRVMVPVKLRHDFLRSLSEDDQKTWKAALAWYQKNQTEARTAARRPAEDEDED